MCYAGGFEDGGRGHKPRIAGGHYKLGKARKQNLQKEHSTYNTFV